MARVSGDIVGNGMAAPVGAAAYDAFISYSQRGDKAVARALRTVIQTIGKPWWKLRSLDVFLDATSLSAAPGLWDSIAAKLDRSRYLILLASPEAAASPWVDKEVAHFVGHDGAALDRLLIGLTEGELRWDGAAGDFAWDDRTPLPPSLRGRFGAEPLWVDLRPFRADPARATKSDQGFLHAALDLAATIKGVEKADLYSDELRQQRRSLRLAYGAAIVVAGLAVGAGIAALIAVERAEVARVQTGIAEAEADRATREADRANLSEARATEAQEDAETQRDEAKRQADIAAAERDRAEEQAQVATEQRNQALRTKERFLTREAEPYLDAGNYGTALALLSEAVDPQLAAGQGIEPATEAALRRALSGNRELATTETGDDAEVLVTPARTHAVVATPDAFHVFALETAEEIATVAADTKGAEQVAVDGERLVVVYDDGVSAWSLDGAPLLREEAPSVSDWGQAADLSADGRFAALVRNRSVKLVDTQAGTMRSLDAHPRSVIDARFSPDGRTLVTISADGTVILWSSETGAPLATVHDDGAEGGMFLPGGTRVMTWNGAGAVALRDARTGERLSAIALQTDADLSSGTFTAAPDEATLLYADYGRVLLFSLADGSVLLDADAGRAAFSGDGKRLLVVRDDSATIHSTADGAQLSSAPVSEEPFDFAVDPDLARLAYPTDDGIVVVDLEEAGAADVVLVGHRAHVPFLSFLPGVSDRLVSASFDGTVRLWNTGDIGTRRTFSAGGQRIAAARFSPDGQLLAAIDAGGRAGVWNLATGDKVRELAVEGAPATVAFSPDGRFLVFAGEEMRTQVLDLATGRASTFSPGAGTIVLSPDSKWLVEQIYSRSSGQVSRIWDLATASLVRSWKNVGDPSFSPDGARVLLTGDEAVVEWDVAADRELRRIERSAFSASYAADGSVITIGGPEGASVWGEAGEVLHVDDAEISRLVDDGSRLVTYDQENGWVSRDAASGEIRCVISDEAPAELQFSPSGRWIFSDFPPRVTDTASCEPVAVSSGSGALAGIAWSGDEATVATLEDGAPARAWDLATGSLLFEAAAGPAYTASSLSADGRLLAVGDDDGGLAVYEIASGDALIAMLRERPARSLVASERRQFFLE